ncbi:MAG: DNA cytosine methyltransferase [Anaerolineae bacterium]|jgi:DNA (cytosine-5)-methyltransferase 1|nr:DNA cytosine methyltransferase [Anaerolineae bacterium]
MTLRAIDLFCGIGGNSWGARQAGVEIVAGFDKWDLAGQVYNDNFPGAFRPADLARLTHTDLLHLRDEIGPIDLLLASPECTSHSVARGGKPKDEDSLRLSWNVWRFARVFQPRWMVIENVTAMKSWPRYKDFLRVLRQKGNYECLPQSLIASHFGVPQRRLRLYIVLDRERAPQPVVSTSAEEPPACEVLAPNGRYAFSKLDKPGRAAKTLARAERAFEALGRDTPFLMVYYGTDASGGWQKLEAPLRTVTTLDRFALVRPDGEGGHLMRMLQPDELQKAMGFPQEFRLERGCRREKIHLLGNAVCPPVMEAIVRSLLAGHLEPEVEAQEPAQNAG